VQQNEKRQGLIRAIARRNVEKSVFTGKLLQSNARCLCRRSCRNSQSPRFRRRSESIGVAKQPRDGEYAADCDAMLSSE
jgi:hypothetical protein